MATTLKHRSLGNTGIELTELTLGTWGLFASAYGHVFPEQQMRTLGNALQEGIRSFDMAPVWGDETKVQPETGFPAQAERAVALAVGSRRDEMTYITRAGMTQTADGTLGDFSPEGLRAQCEGSLVRLGTDRIDVWLLHNPQEADLRRDEVRSLAEELVQAGKIRAWGASVSHLDDAQAALDAGAQVLCLPFHLLSPRLVWDLEADLRARRVGLLARSSLCHGLLAARWSGKKRFPPDDQRVHRWSTEALTERVEQLNERRFLMRSPVVTMAQAAHRFVLAHDVVSSLVLGARTPGQVDASIPSDSVSTGGPTYLPPDDLARLRAMNE
jgi:aryl-alcohol dehydrogenase-like predicted oxidoreductase